MVTKRKVTGTAMSVPAGIAVGVGVSAGMSVLGAALIAWLVDGTYISEAGIGYGAMITLLISSATGAWIAIQLVKHQKLPVALSCGVAFFAFLVGITAFFFGGQYQGVVPTVLIVIGGSLLPALLSSIGQGNRTRKYRKIHSG